MSKFEVINSVPISQAYYSLNGKMQVVDSNSGGEACYNVPKDFVIKALEIKALTLDKKVKQTLKKENNDVYVLSDDYSLLLGEGLRWIINEEDNKLKYKIVITKRTNGKYVMAKVDFKALETNDEGYKWFNRVYEKNIEGFGVAYSIDEKSKKIVIDVRLSSIKQNEDVEKNVEQEIDENQNLNEIRFKRNRIIFGAPGTGKSYKLDQEKMDLIGNDTTRYERVTFHPDYTYANFVGTYKPVMKVNDAIVDEKYKKIFSILNDINIESQNKYQQIYECIENKGAAKLLTSFVGECNIIDANGEISKDNSNINGIYNSICKYIRLNNLNNEISYEYVPGPFMRLFVKAMKHPDTSYLLIIEEINRANVSAVFGDLFQLLDRDDNETSMYPVEATEDIKKYLAKECINLLDNKIKIPNNMFIWATMNSADQGVFPMDTAFKRRWDFDYIGIDDNEDKIKDKCFNIEVVNKNEHSQLVPIYWNDIRKAINKYLSDNKINEDKQLGPYFISKKVLFSNDDKEFLSTFKNKVIMYLFDDAAKQKRPDIFMGVSNKKYDSNRYSSICECFDKYGLEIFNDGIINEYINLIAKRENGNKE